MAAKNLGVWGIDLGQCALKAIRLENVEGQVTATAYDFIEYPKILSQPDADPDQLTREALEAFLSRNKLQGDMVAIGVPGQSGLARFVKLPPVEEKKIVDIVRFEAKQQIPFPLEEVVWDYQKIGAGMVTDGFALETEIGLFAMKRDMVNRYLQHFKDVNVEVHLVQMAPLALCNFVSYDLLRKDGQAAGEEQGGGKRACVVALEIGTDNSNLVITDGDKIIWQRPIPLGGNHFTRALTKDLKLTFAKAEHLKRNAVKSPDLKKILAALKSVLNDFVGEVQRSLGYFTNTHRDAQIQYTIALGNAFRLPGLQKYLQEKLQLEVRKLQSLERLAGEDVTQAPQFTENILGFGVAYGLALQGLNLTRLQTNLLPYEIRLERMVRAKKPWAVAAAASLLLAVAGLTFARNLEYRAVDPKKPENAAATAAATAILAKKLDFETQFDNAKRDYDDSVKAIMRIGSGVQQRFNWDLLYQYVNMALPRPDVDMQDPEAEKKDKVPRKTRQGFHARTRYVTNAAVEAHHLVLEKRFAKASGAGSDTKNATEVDEKKIKPHLIQINVEGVAHMYFDDLAPYFNALRQKIKDENKENLPGMDDKEFTKVKSSDASLPKKGWIVEIRGYTHHKDGEFFVANTFLENLGNPAGVKNVLNKDMKEKIKDRMSYLWINQEKDPRPEPGRFKFINHSYLSQLLKGSGKEQKGESDTPPAVSPSAQAGPGEGMAKKGGAGGKASKDSGRGGWRPIGEIAGSLFGGGGSKGAGGGFPGGSLPGGVEGPPKQGNGTTKTTGVFRQPRTEFFIQFVWHEPTLEDAQVVGSTTTKE